MARERYPSIQDHTALNTQADVTFVAGVLAAVNDLPSDVVPGDLRARFRAAVGSLDRCVRSCEGDIRRGHLTGRDLRELLMLLEQFPDEPFRPNDTALRFIEDEAFRRTLSVDIAAAHRALSHGEWKASTVLAGSVLEALCLWAIRAGGDDANALGVADTLRRQGVLRAVPAELLKWHAHELIEVAFAMQLIGEDTVQIARTTRNYRNLIHPGKELRTGQTATEGTAYVAVGTMERVIEDLQRRNK